MGSSTALACLVLLSVWCASVSYAHGSMEKHLRDHIKQLEVVFEKIDANKDRFLDREELLAMATEMDRLHLDDDVDHEFLSLDHDGDKLISVEECMFNHFDKNVTEEEVKSIENGKFSKEESEFWMKRSIKKFRKADENNDGLLSKSELKYFLHPEAYDEMKDVLVEETMEDYDSNGDGFIESEEYNGMGHPGGMFDESVRPPNPEDGGDIFTGPLDKDKDGRLNRDEVWSWLSMQDDRFHAEEVDHILGETDENKDGKLSFEEVQNHDHQILGSAVTGFGRMLRDHDEF